MAQREKTTSYTVRSVCLSEIDQIGWCNTNNHRWDDFPIEIQQLGIDKPLTGEEYKRRKQLTNYSNYAHILHDSYNNHSTDNRIKVELTCEIIKDLIEIGTICQIRGKITATVENDFNYVVRMIQQQIPKEYLASKNVNLHSNTLDEKKQESTEIDPDLLGKDYFVRLDDCSPKDTFVDDVNGIGPFHNVSKIVQSIVTSKRCVQALQSKYYILQKEIRSSHDHDHNTNNLKQEKVKEKCSYLWLILWRDDISEENEFRCFVRDGRLNAISQYLWFKNFDWFDNVDKQRLLVPIANKVQELIDNQLINVLPLKLNDFVLDIHVTIKDESKFVVEIIELNSFGAQLAAGAGLFHWINDYNQLYGLQHCQNKVEIRVFGTKSKTIITTIEKQNGSNCNKNEWKPIFTF